MCTYRNEKEFGLLRIEENLSAIENLEKEHQEYIEYEYYNSSGMIPFGVGFLVIPAEHWTTDADTHEQDLTGNVRIHQYKYRGYAFAKIESGHEIVIVSAFVDSLKDVKENFPYFKIKQSIKEEVYSSYLDEIYSKK